MTIPLWRLFLGLYLFIIGGITLFSLSFDGMPVFLGLSAIIAGIVLLFFGDAKLGG